METAQNLELVVITPAPLTRENRILDSVREEIELVLGPTLGVHLEFRTHVVSAGGSDGGPGAGPDPTRAGIVLGILPLGSQSEPAATEQAARLLRRALESQGESPPWVRLLVGQPRPPRSWQALPASIWTYQNSEELESYLRRELTERLLRQFRDRVPTPGGEDLPDLTPPPEPVELIPRSAVRENLTARLRADPVVSLMGQIGMGKTLLAAAVLTGLQRAGVYRRILWHELIHQETLDGFFVRLGGGKAFQGLSLRSKTSRLLEQLARERAILVIDDFHRAARPSYDLLPAEANRRDAPARLLLLSRPEPDRAAEAMTVPGFQLEEVRAYWDRWHPATTEPEIRVIAEATEGRPLALSLFRLLRCKFHQDPEDLLSQPGPVEQRMQGWGRRLLDLLREDQQQLLRALSHCNCALQIGEARSLAGLIGLAQADRAVHQLERLELLHRHGGDRWRVQPMMAELCREITLEEEGRRFHGILGQYALGNAPLQVGRRIDQAELAAKVRACHHFQRAGKMERASEVLLDISATVKLHGHYEMYVNLIEPHLTSHPDRDPWLDYNYAHCSSILGRLERSRQVLEPWLQRLPEEMDRRIGFLRLYSEILGMLGQVEPALKLLGEALESCDPATIGAVVWAHARSILAWLYGKQGRHELAEEIGQELLATARSRNDPRSAAVAWARIGVSQRLQHRHQDSTESLEEAIRLFRESGDRRGLGWSLSESALAMIGAGRIEQGLLRLEEGLRLRSDLGECSQDYRHLLEEAADEVSEESSLDLIQGEISRLDSQVY